MKKAMCLIATLMMSGLSIAQAAFPIEGNWGTTLSQGGMQFDMTFTIQNNTITLTNVCSMNGQFATARVSSPAAYDASSITIFNSGSDDQNSADYSVHCNVSIQPERLNYVVQGNLLIFSQNGSPQTFALTRK